MPTRCAATRDRSRVPDAVRHEVTLRRAGTQNAATMGPGSAAHHVAESDALRCARGTLTV